jgi:hypothetical protein
MSNLPERFRVKAYELASHGLVGWVVGWVAFTDGVKKSGQSMEPLLLRGQYLIREVHSQTVENTQRQNLASF